MTVDVLGKGVLGFVPLMSLADVLGRLESVVPFDGDFSEMDERRE